MIGQTQQLHSVTRWRRARLLEAGFPLRAAQRAAADPRYDVHALIELAERGCPWQLALRIVAPLEEDRVA